MKVHYDIELSTLQHFRLTEPFELLNICIDAADQQLRPSNSVCVTASRTGDVTALLYWFEMTMGVMADASVVVDTSDERCHWSQAAILFYDETSVVEGVNYTVQTTCDNGYLGVEVLPTKSE
jgi:hypothetical protein